MPSFYFEQVLQTALNGIDQNVTGPVLRLAGVILILSLLYAVYEAYSNGGDVRALGVAGVKYLVLGLVFLNYQQAFRSVNGMFNGVADFIYNTNGIGDVVQNWLNSVSAYVGQQGLSSFWTLVTGAISGLLDVLLILAGLVILPVSYTLFTLAYAMYGSILYLVGPFVLALWPSRAMGQLSRTYFVNLMIFQSWGLLYAILQVLMTALQMNSVNAVLGGNGVLNAFVGSSQMVLLGAVSVLFSIAIVLIPFIASRLVRGEVGSTVFALSSPVPGFMQMRRLKRSSIPAERHKLQALVLPRECLTTMRAAVGRVGPPLQEEAALAAGYWPNQNLRRPQAQA